MRKFKTILKKIGLKRQNTPLYNDILISNKTITIGKGTAIEKLSISIQVSKESNNMISIGNDSIIEGQIILYSEKARIQIGNRVFIGPNTTLFCYDSIEIEDDVMISWGCTLIDTNAHSLISSERSSDVLDWKNGNTFKNWSNVISKPVVIERNAWIGFNTIIMKGVTIKEATVIAAGSVVTKSTKSYSIYGGNPAKFLKQTS
ncbi:MAG: acyltransferase [Sphingobacteriales bacterium]|nr:acyltransferase [Sphingobacteriales bacterium]